MPYIIRPRRLHVMLAGLCGALTLIVASPAMASSTPCPSTAISHPFASYGDAANYSLVEGGLFESGAPNWSLSEAEVVSESPEEESQSYREFSRYGRSHSLLIEGEAVSAAFCVDSEYPSFRFLFKARRGRNPRLNVSLRWTASGKTHETNDASLEGNGKHWTISPVLELASKLPAGTTTGVRMVFQAEGGAFVIDDVYIDPYSR